ncbi:MAG TPA: trypsin-like peptidase domain-containing protein, partial [Gemmataceae bacterium]|nr:trypsin-like peptidase domain-containing protein [Gemmataceae bacterium]
MDRRQMIIQRVREIFGDGVDDLLHIVRQDRQEMRGWQEPAHLRAALRRAVRQEGAPDAANEPATTTAVAEAEFIRAAGEPDPGQQREAVGRVLEAGAAGLERIVSGATDLTAEQVSGLETILLLYGRPAILISGGNLGAVPSLWNLLEDQREDVEMAQRGVGRIELFGHPEYDWAGTGFLVNDNVLMTTRRIAEVFIENRGAAWQFRPGITTWMDYRSGYPNVANAGCRVRSVVGVHEQYDLALLEVEKPQINGSAPTPLALAAAPPSQSIGRPVYLIGYPIRDARRNEPETISRIFRDVYGVKRIQPGQLRGNFAFHEIQFLRHDCAPLGQTAGAPILDMET